MSEPDPGISPEQLREKVEALEKRIADVAHVAASVSGLYDDVWTRLDAALKRIEQLEQQQARWRGNARLELEP